MLLYSKCTNAALSTLEHHVALHIHPESKTLLIPHFEFLLIDESGQALEPELMIPIAVVVPACNPDIVYDPAHSPHIAICGDHKQLGPRVESEKCRATEMDLSVLERLFKRYVYRKHPMARAMMTQELRIRATRLSLLAAPFCNLTKNYRSHPAILMLPSTLVRHFPIDLPNAILMDLAPVLQRYTHRVSSS